MRAAEHALPGSVGRLSRKVLALLHQLQFRQGGHDGLYHPDILGGLDTAGAVHNSPTGTQSLNGFEEQPGLQDDQFLLTLFTESPASFGATRQNSGIGAGCIDEDRVEGACGEVAAVPRDQSGMNGLKFESSSVITHSMQSAI